MESRDGRPTCPNKPLIQQNSRLLVHVKIRMSLVLLIEFIFDGQHNIPFMIFHTFHPLILTLILALSTAASVSAISQSCPFRTGSIYVVYPGLTALSENTTINFDMALLQAPTGVIVAPRSIETSDVTSRYLDYSFGVQNITTSGFHFNMKLCQIYPLDYTKVIVSYWTNSPIVYQEVYSRLPNNTPSIQILGNFRIYTWTISTVSIHKPTSPSYLSHAFISEFVGDFDEGLVFIDQIGIIYNTNTKTIVYYYNMSSKAIVTSLKLSTMIFDTSFQSAAEYQMKMSSFNVMNAQTKYKIEDARSYPTVFFGLGTVGNSLNSSKVGFYFGYQTEPILDNTFQYRQNNPLHIAIMSQQSNPTIRYAGRIGFYGIKKCPEDTIYLYLQERTQLCHDICPVGRYTNNITKKCLQCYNCVTISSCEECYTTGCQEGMYFNFTEFFKCSACSETIPNCEKCFANSTGLPYCTGCLAGYYVKFDQQCELCSLANVNCESCEDGTGVCKSCLLSSKTELVGGVCQPCNFTSYFHPIFKQCRLCSAQIPNCSRCHIDEITLDVICESCLILDRYYLLLNACSSCPTGFYLNPVAQTCTSCHPFCTNCLSQTTCQSCFSPPTTSYVLRNSTCIQCNPDNTYLQSPLPFCHKNKYQCSFIYNPTTQKCEVPEIQTVVVTFGTFTSIPTINIMYRQISILMGLLDDLSYYNYHHREYLSQIETMFGDMMNFTLSRFTPFELESVYEKFEITYSDQILQNNVKRLPEELENTDGTVYFLLTTQSVWTTTLPFSVLVFAVMMGFHWGINHWFKTSAFKSYNYVGMIVVGLLSSNIQYLSFRCFSQLFQTVPISPMYFFNLVFCYFILFILIIYSISAVTIFKLIYRKVGQKYVEQQLFGESSKLLFCGSNLLKIATGFLHSCLHNNPIIQNALLIFTSLVKLRVLGICHKRISSKLLLVGQLVSTSLMLILQCFFLFEIISVEFEFNEISSLEYMGDMEYLLVFSMIACHIVMTVCLSVKYVAEYLIVKFGSPQINKDVACQIRIIKRQHNPQESLISQVSMYFKKRRTSGSASIYQNSLKQGNLNPKSSKNSSFQESKEAEQTISIAPISAQQQLTLLNQDSNFQMKVRKPFRLMSSKYREPKRTQKHMTSYYRTNKENQGDSTSIYEIKQGKKSKVHSLSNRNALKVTLRLENRQ